MILSTRESAETRRELLHLGISQISAGSRTDVGAYHRDTRCDSAKFISKPAAEEEPPGRAPSRTTANTDRWAYEASDPIAACR
jgi:hypothetical protein